MGILSKLFRREPEPKPDSDDRKELEEAALAFAEAELAIAKANLQQAEDALKSIPGRVTPLLAGTLVLAGAAMPSLGRLYIKRGGSWLTLVLGGVVCLSMLISCLACINALADAFDKSFRPSIGQGVVSIDWDESRLLDEEVDQRTRAQELLTSSRIASLASLSHPFGAAAAAKVYQIQQFATWTRRIVVRVDRAKQQMSIAFVSFASLTVCAVVVLTCGAAIEETSNDNEQNEAILAATRANERAARATEKAALASERAIQEATSGAKIQPKRLAPRKN